MDGFSIEWEDGVYQKNKQICKWPWSDLVSLVCRYFHRPFEGKSVLEFGCGSGPNIPFFLDNGFNYYAIEGSATVVDSLRKSYPQLVQNIVCGDFNVSLSKCDKYDLIFDRASITHNTSRSISSIVKKIHDLLNPGSFFIGVDWFSIKHSDYALGDFVDDRTKTNYISGQFKSIGNVHFFDYQEITSLFSEFEFLSLHEKVKTSFLNEKNSVLASWDFVVKRR